MSLVSPPPPLEVYEHGNISILCKISGNSHEDGWAVVSKLTPPVDDHRNARVPHPEGDRMCSDQITG